MKITHISLATLRLQPDATQNAVKESPDLDVTVETTTWLDAARGLVCGRPVVRHEGVHALSYDGALTLLPLLETASHDQIELDRVIRAALAANGWAVTPPVPDAGPSPAVY